MMALFGMRITRILPFIIILAVVALAIYLIVSAMRSPQRAKEILIKVFTIICLVIIVFFALVAIYAIFDHSEAVFELSLGFAGVGVVGLIITLICNYFFRKHHPHYRDKAKKARIIRHWPWERRN